ncbi:MAG: helix-turn-helix domain-containing protein [Clostridia bacterium]|nr:helix-turn-helix domain-containing protein [Clostridia bacterium]
MVHKDCFAYHKSKAGSESCKALKVIECGKCKFYKKENPQAVSTYKNHRTTPYEKEQIIQLFKDRYSRRQIATATGVSYDIVCYIIRQHIKENKEG